MTKPRSGPKVVSRSLAIPADFEAEDGEAMPDPFPASTSRRRAAPIIRYGIASLYDTTRPRILTKAALAPDQEIGPFRPGSGIQREGKLEKGLPARREHFVNRSLRDEAVRIDSNI